jgi:hypothetical protein
MLESITDWQARYHGNPCVVSLNWATQHPLLDVSRFDYVQWGTPADSERLPYYQEMFGEASELYPVVHQHPTIAELAQIKRLLERMSLLQ